MRLNDDEDDDGADSHNDSSETVAYDTSQYGSEKMPVLQPQVTQFLKVMKSPKDHSGTKMSHPSKSYMEKTEHSAFSRVDAPKLDPKATLATRPHTLDLQSKPEKGFQLDMSSPVQHARLPSTQPRQIGAKSPYDDSSNTATSKSFQAQSKTKQSRGQIPASKPRTAGNGQKMMQYKQGADRQGKPGPKTYLGEGQAHGLQSPLLRPSHQAKQTSPPLSSQSAPVLSPVHRNSSQLSPPGGRPQLEAQHHASSVATPQQRKSAHQLDSVQRVSRPKTMVLPQDRESPEPGLSPKKPILSPMMQKYLDSSHVRESVASKPKSFAAKKVVKAAAGERIQGASPATSDLSTSSQSPQRFESLSQQEEGRIDDEMIEPQEVVVETTVDQQLEVSIASISLANDLSIF